MGNCPECGAGLSWMANTDLTPATSTETYLCPDPDCAVAVVRVMADE